MDLQKVEKDNSQITGKVGGGNRYKSIYIHSTESAVLS